MKKIGRPKMSREQHLAGYKETLNTRIRVERYEKRKAQDIPVDDPTYEEAKEILTQVYEKVGPTAALKSLNKFECQKLSSMDKIYFDRFIAHCKELLSHN